MRDEVTVPGLGIVECSCVDVDVVAILLLLLFDEAVEKAAAGDSARNTLRIVD